MSLIRSFYALADTCSSNNETQVLIIILCWLTTFVLIPSGIIAVWFELTDNSKHALAVADAKFNKKFFKRYK